MSGLFPPADAADAGRAYDLSVQLREKLDLVIAVRFSLQIILFLLESIGEFVRVGQQIIRLCMGEVENVKERLPVLCGPVSESAGSAVFQRYDFMILQQVSLPSVY